jgi:hypothetical protein
MQAVYIILSVPAAELKEREKQLRQVWWYMLLIPTLRRLRQEAYKFKASLGYIGRPCLKQTNKQLESILMNIFYLSQYIQNISICKQY